MFKKYNENAATSWLKWTKHMINRTLNNEMYSIEFADYNFRWIKQKSVENDI